MTSARWVLALMGLVGAMAFGGRAAAEPKCMLQKVVDLPVTMVGTRPTLQAKINGRDVTFIVDSGAFYSTLSGSIAKELGLRLEAPPFYLRVYGVGGEADIMLARVKTFTFANVPIPNIDFIVTTGEGQSGYAGLLGQNIWGLADVEYDLGAGAIRVFVPHDCGDVPLAYWAGGKPYNQLSINYAEEKSKKVFASAFVNGHRLRVILDTGASTSVMTMAAAARAGLKPDTPGVRSAGVSGGVGSRAVRAWIGPVASFKIGDEEVKNTQLRFADIELLGADMLLGADFFLSHRIYVANSQTRVYFTYSGGPVFSLDAARPVIPPVETAEAAAQAAADQPVPGDEPRTADAISRRGAASAGRHDYERALADFNRAIELEPLNAVYRYQRATTRLALKQLPSAMEDIQEALRLNPGYTDALLVRAELRMNDKNPSEAETDLDRVSDLAPKTADVRLQLAILYARMNRLERALAQFDLWIDAHENDHELSRALGGRCRVRMLANLEPDKALADCNRAIRLGPPTPFMYESRAILELRAGALDRSIEDLNRVLTADPKSALGLYARGVARLRKGQRSEGEADVNAAMAISPGVEENARRLGVSAPPASAPAPAAAVR